MKKVILLLLILFVSAGFAATVDYEIYNVIEKTYDGNRWHSWKFISQLIFTDLTFTNRRTLGLPISKPNLNFDPNDPNSLQTIPNYDPNEIVSFSSHIPPFTDSNAIKAEIIRRIEKVKTQYELRLIPDPKKETLTLTGNKFKATLITK